MGQPDNVSYIGLVRNFIGCREKNVQLPTHALGTILTPFDLLRTLRTGPRFPGGILIEWFGLGAGSPSGFRPPGVVKRCHAVRLRFTLEFQASVADERL
jgi:hypothetical protein